MFFTHKPALVKSSHISKTTRRKSGQADRASFKPCLEALESRDLLSVAQLVLVAPSSTIGGQPAVVEVEALNANGQIATNYTGTVQFSSSDTAAGLPSNYTFTITNQGIHFFAIPFETAGAQTLTVSDTSISSLTATANMNVINSVNHFQVSIANNVSNVAPGDNVAVTVTAINQSGTVDTNYQGTVQFTSSDSSAVLPENYTFTSADDGSHTFTVNLLTAGNEQVTATDTNDSAVTGSASVNVTAGAIEVAQLELIAPSSTILGLPAIVEVAALSSTGQVVTDYIGTVHFSSSDTAAGLPSDYTFTSTDQGIHAFSIPFQTAGAQTLTVSNTSALALTATANLNVISSMDHFQVTIGNNLGDVSAGANVGLTVTAINGSGAVDTNFRGTVHLTSSDSNAALPGNYTFTSADAGSHTFTINLLKAGNRQVTVTDIANSALMGSASVIVTPGVLAKLALLGPNPSVSAIGGVSSITVVAEDAYGNSISSYLGTISFTSTDNAASLPDNYTFTNADGGSHTFAVTLQTLGMQTITATNTQDSSLTGSINIRVRQSDANAEFVNQVYEDLLGRSVDTSGETYWMNYLNNNGSRLQMVSTIENSVEYHTLAVNNLYEQVLGRSADAAGLSYYVSALSAGTTLTQVEASLLNSQEYFNNQGATNNGFLAGLYQTVLGRSIDSSGQNFFGSALANDGSRLAVINSLLNSREADTDTVKSIYEQFLHRPADTGGLNTYASDLQQGWTAQQVIAYVVASKEYYAQD